MLYPLIVIIGIALFIRSVAVPVRNFMTENRTKRAMLHRAFKDLQHNIRYCPNTVGLEQYTNQVIELFEEYRREKGIRMICGQLHADLENKRRALQEERKKARA